MGPVIGATSVTYGLPVIRLRTKANRKKDITYATVMCARLARQIVNRPTTQITSMGQRSFPHCTLNGATAKGARKRRAQMPKLLGFQRCRRLMRSTYFDMMETTPPSA
jgi:hypothetical protein